MKKIVRFNPAIGTMNKGDEIIANCINAELSFLLNGNFCMDISTHYPLNNDIYRIIAPFDYKFVYGTNLLRNNLEDAWPIDTRVSNVILIGCSWKREAGEISSNTKKVLKEILSTNAIHSVRDSYTLQKLREIGIENVCNTACPTMWTLTDSHTQTIPKTKARNVVTTLTDYKKNVQHDTQMLDVLLANYEKVYLWLQGVGDYDYFRKIASDKKIALVGPTVSEYERVIISDDIEYVGTRLHAGVLALVRGKRTLILGVDERANNLHCDFGLPVIHREDVCNLERIINGENILKLNLPQKEIMSWRSQFI